MTEWSNRPLDAVYAAVFSRVGESTDVVRKEMYDFETKGGDYASRVYVIAERVEFLNSRNRSTGQATAADVVARAQRDPQVMLSAADAQAVGDARKAMGWQIDVTDAPDPCPQLVAEREPGDLFGPRRIFLVGLTIFTLASLACVSSIGTMNEASAIAS